MDAFSFSFLPPNSFSLSYLSTKYNKIALDSLHDAQLCSVSRRNNIRIFSPNDEIIIVVVNEGRNTTIRVVLRVFLCFLLLCREVEVDRFIAQAKLVHEKGSFPVSNYRQ